MSEINSKLKDLDKITPAEWKKDCLEFQQNVTKIIDQGNPERMQWLAEHNYLLSLIVSLGNVELVEKLINLGADVNKICDTKLSPLHKAVRINNHDIVRLLINKGANVNILDHVNRTPFYYAVINGMTEIAQTLLKAGADMNLLHDAIFEGYVKEVKLSIRLVRNKNSNNS